MNVLLVISCMCLLTVCTAHKGKGKLTITPTDNECTPRKSKTCGESVPLSEEITVQPEEKGENVCKTTRTYQIQTLSYVEADYCRGSKCKTYCVATNNCTGAFVNVTAKPEKSCCDGFVEDTTVSSPSSRKGRRGKSLSCTIMLRESVADCLLELNLESLLTESLEEFGDAESSEDYTIFALNDTSLEGVEVPDSLLGYVVDGAFRFEDGMVFPTLAEDVYLHIGKGEENFFVNGVEVTELNACQARNGIVHIVNSAIPQSSMTIAEQLSEDSRFSTFLQLLDEVNITMFIDVAGGKSRTAFVPTNDAFDDLPEGVVECLQQPENINSLRSLLLTHISSPAQYSATLSQQSKLSTFYRRNRGRSYRLRVTVDDGEIFLTKDLIPLEENDISANNGVIHVLPDVIVPSNLDFDKLKNCATINGSGNGAELEVM